MEITDVKLKREMMGLPIAKRDCIVKARYAFEGWFRVHAASKEDAKRIVKENCGMRFGEIQADVPDVMDWEFDMKPIKTVR